MAFVQAKVPHVVAIPYPAQGHITPMLHLCQQLAPHGFTFTFVNTHHIHRRIQDANSAHGFEPGGAVADADTVADAPPGKEAHTNVEEAKPMKQTGVNSIRMVFVEGGCAPELLAHMSTSNQAYKAAQTMKVEVEKLISNIMEEQPVAFILTDILLGWSNQIASKFGVPWVCFWPLSAATCAALVHFADLGQQGKSVPIADKQDRAAVSTLEGIPGLPPTCLDDLPKVWDDHTGKVGYGILKYFHNAQKASFLLFNTFAELEGQALQALSKRYSALAVGPLLPAQYIFPDKTASLKLDGISLFQEDRSCLQWLDKQAPSSVLFISFGSISARSDEQLEELALAVEASGCPYLWVRTPDITAGRTSGRSGQSANGFVVSWAPQLDVLSHPAVGGFITHCGWNSVMESVAMGVPMLCWADKGERMSNQRFIVQFWQCGMDMVTDARRYYQHIDDRVIVRHEEIERSIRCLMLEEVGSAIRAQATRLRNSAVTAFLDSRSKFNYFVKAMQYKSLDNSSHSPTRRADFPITSIISQKSRL